MKKNDIAMKVIDVNKKQILYFENFDEVKKIVNRDYSYIDLTETQRFIEEPLTK
jgi:hypothetical protein